MVHEHTGKVIIETESNKKSRPKNEHRHYYKTKY
jgi:hypothetical protein